MLHSINARTGEILAEISSNTLDEVDATCVLAKTAFDGWQSSDASERASLLRALADVLVSDREALVSLADVETALGAVRLNGELDRTVFQLRRFADLAVQGVPYRVVDDPAVAGTPPVGHPAMQRWQVPLGPVAVFSASNFPFAFSVLGGDTASALAAGCSVVVKAHTGHLQLSQRVHGLIQKVLKSQKQPAGLIGLVQGAGREIGMRLIQHSAVAAGAFTGSTKGGAALASAAAARSRPIPFFGELGSTNPVIAWPQMFSENGEQLAQALAASITQGCGQFCTSPGVLVLLDDADEHPQASAINDAFVVRLTAALRGGQLHAMLTPAMHSAFVSGVEQWVTSGAKVHLNGPSKGVPAPTLVEVGAETFIKREMLREEVFGPACIVVRAANTAQVVELLSTIGGSLTVTLWGADAQTDSVTSLVRAAIAIAGRVLFSGVPTGVAVTAAQQHGGPWPSSTRPDATSVGDAALSRFLRPVCIQDPPIWLKRRAGRLV